MKNLLVPSRRTRLVALVFIASMLIATGLQAGEIHDAAASGDLNKVEALLVADPALLESKDSDGNTPLISACWGPPANGPRVAVADFLIDKGANINARNDRGATPLYFALKDPDLAQRLVARGADVNIRAFGDHTPLHQAAFSGDLRVAKLLIDHGANLDASGAQGTVLHRIIYQKTKAGSEMAKLLIESGARLQEFSYGNTELHLAALDNYADVVPILVKHGANVDAVNSYGHAPLYYAARHGHSKTADALIAAGANKSVIVEANYGKAPQLNEKLKEGEAYLWYLGGTESPYAGYAVKTKGHLLIFNPPEIDDSLEAGLANGHLNPNELAGQRLTALILYPSYQGRLGRPSVAELAQRLPGINLVLNLKPTADSADSRDLPPYHLATPHESFSMDGIKVHTIPAARRLWFSGDGLGYLVEADGVKILHAGAHASGNGASELEKYRKEIDFLKSFGPIDIAILPINGRHTGPGIAYEPYLYLLDQLSPKAVYLMGDDLATDEHKRCAGVLRARSVPVFYPEGGIAVGERFHYLRDQASATPAPKTDALSLSGPYLGQPLPGEMPQVFARGIVSTDDQQHGAPTFSPDGNEVFWQTNRLDSEKKWHVSVMTARRVGDRWTPPEVSPYGGGPVFSPDGQRLYFDSKGEGDDPYYLEKQGDRWGENKYVRIVSRFPELKFAYNVSIARSGTLYFLGHAGGLGLWNDYGLYRAELINGEYTKPELLPPSVNPPGALNWTPFVAPDESYLIFCSRRMIPKDDYGDLYVCFRQPDGTWSDRVSLGAPINSKVLERFPTVSPDGKYLFFTRWTPEHDEDVFWVSAEIVEQVKAKTIQEQRLKSGHRQEAPK
jgi:ankyrin repeat protein